MPERSLTIQDIAKLAGVSKATVSRYLNGKYEYMSLQTKERIEQIIVATGYQPNHLARTLKSKRSMMVGIVVADIGSSFTSAAVRSIGISLREKGYGIITASSDNSYELEKEYLRSLMAQQVDGLIVNTTMRHNPYLIRLANDGVPVVLLDRSIDNYMFDMAYISNQNPIIHAIEHLKEEGYGRIALFTQPFDHVFPRAARQEAFLEKMRDIGKKDPSKSVYVSDISDLDSIANQVYAFYQAGERDVTPSAIIAANGMMLMTCARAILSLGIPMPHGIGLMGYDDWGKLSELGWASMAGGGLTTMAPSVNKLGEMAVEFLLERMTETNSSKRTYQVEAPLIRRGSTAHGCNDRDLSIGSPKPPYWAINDTQGKWWV